MSKNGMNAGMIGVSGHYYQSTHESLRSDKYASEIIFPENLFFIKLSHLLSRLDF